MIPFPALGGALMDAHDRIETSSLLLTLATLDLLYVETQMAELIGWSVERVNHRGCQLWGELIDDDRFTEVGT